MQNKSRVLIIGSMNVVFTHSYAYEFKKMGCDVQILDVGRVNVNSDFINQFGVRTDKYRIDFQGNYYRNLFLFAKKLLKKLALDRNYYVIKLIDGRSKRDTSGSLPPVHVQNIILKFNPEVILYLWSTTVLAEKFQVDGFYRRNANLILPRTSLLVNTYPVRANSDFNSPGEMPDADRKFFSSFDSVFVPTEEMRILFDRMDYNVENINIHDDLLSPKYVDKDFSSNGDIRDQSYSVIFLGNTNFDLRSIDDTRVILNKIAEAGANVFIQRPNDISGLHKNVRFFEPFSYKQMLQGDLSRYISGFDAAIVSYGDLRNARSQTSMPTRFALALTGGVPVLLARNNYLGIKKRFRAFGAVVEYDETDDFLELLRHCREMKHVGVEKFQKHYVETFRNNFEKFCRTVFGMG